MGLLCGGFSPALSADYYVTPTPPPNLACPSGSPCHTLDNYAVNTSQLFGNEENITLIFLDGVHELNHDLVLSNLQEVVIMGLNNSLVDDTLPTSVSISFTSRLALVNIISVTIKKINILRKAYGNPELDCFQVKDVEQFNGYQMMLLKTCLMSFEISFSLIGPQMKISITDSLFNRSEIEITSPPTAIDLNKSLIVTISNCRLLELEGGLTATLFGLQGSISVVDSIIANTVSGMRMQGNHSNISYVIVNCMVTNNIYLSVYLYNFNGNVDVTLINSTFKDNTNTAVRVVFVEQHVNEFLFHTFIVDNCTFQNNVQGIDIQDLNAQLNLRLSSTTFQNHGYIKDLNGDNFGVSGLRVYNLLSNQQDSSEIVISDSTFQNNRNNFPDSGVVLVTNCKKTIFEGTNLFSDNLGTPVQVYLGDLFVSGETTFKNNIGYRGGAIGLSSSHIFLHNASTVTFESNYANDKGGAMYINTFRSHLRRNLGQCFYQMPDLSETMHVRDAKIQLIFINNSATNGGEDIYGAGLQSDCVIGPAGQYGISVYKEIFNFVQTNKSQLSLIASDPTRVCLCNETGEPQCAIESYIFSTVQVFPGEEFALSVVAVGSVYASFLPLNSTSPSLGTNQDSQSVIYSQCNTLTYTVFSKPSTEEVLVLTSIQQTIQEYRDRNLVENNIHIFESVNVIPDELLNLPVYVNVTLQQCPLGFKLTEEPPYKCTCHNKLTENGINNCTIANHSGKVYRSGTVWVSASFRGNESDDIVVDKNCPYGYCTQNNIPVDLQYPDIQCTFGHSGVLCGGCPDNYSLAIGSSACLYCLNNNYLSLLIVFAFAGFALVLFIKVFDLTVSKGTINGLIFYANIVWANQAIVFPQESNPGLAFLRVFIAWLNLDWGIETCFSQGLNGYGKVWLQFVFPIYIWLLAGLIILLCRYSTTATKLFGNNSVAVLATLFLISYAKLLRTIITALGYSVLQYSEGSRTVWSFDGNVDYFSPAHSILFVASLITLVFLWFPYTLFFLLVQFLRKVDHYRVLRWTVKYKPFFDTYTGPLKNKHHYWVGLLLLVRVILLIIVAVTATIAPSFNLVAITLSSAVLLFHPYVYKKWYLTFLENSFFLNLAITSVGILYVDEVNKSQVVYPSVGIAFLQFIVIVGSHVYILIRPCCNKFKTRQDKYNNLDIPPNVRDEQNSQPKKKGYDQLRESLLESVVT